MFWTRPKMSKRSPFSFLLFLCLREECLREESSRRECLRTCHPCRDATHRWVPRRRWGGLPSMEAVSHLILALWLPLRLETEARPHILSHTLSRRTLPWRRLPLHHVTWSYLSVLFEQTSQTSLLQDASLLITKADSTGEQRINQSHVPKSHLQLWASI